jgi:uncharacterized repeat protein (TIGR03847 family)
MAADPFGEHSIFDAQRVKVEAIGEPGNRRFRMLAIVDGKTSILWMEKQQLQALGMALGQLLEHLPEDDALFDATQTPVEFDTATRRQFRVGRMELGYDEQSDRLIIIAHDVNGEEDDDEEGISLPTFACRLTRAQATEISVDSAAVVSAGRPRCPMCGLPMGPGIHVCAQQNGHLPFTIADLEDDV